MYTRRGMPQDKDRERYPKRETPCPETFSVVSDQVFRSYFKLSGQPGLFASPLETLSLLSNNLLQFGDFLAQGLG